MRYSICKEMEKSALSALHPTSPFVFGRGVLQVEPDTDDGDQDQETPASPSTPESLKKDKAYQNSLKKRKNRPNSVAQPIADAKTDSPVHAWNPMTNMAMMTNVINKLKEKVAKLNSELSKKN